MGQKLYIDAAPARKWGKRIALDPHVRIQLDGKIYKATAVRIDDPDIAAKFLKGRIIYRLVPGWDSGNDSR
jgi:hypothetical protein